MSWPIGSGHGCIGCSEENFWDDVQHSQRQGYEHAAVEAFEYLVHFQKGHAQPVRDGEFADVFIRFRALDDGVEHRS